MDVADETSGTGEAWAAVDSANALYQSVAIQRILYAADTFLLPIRKVEGRKALAGSVGHIKMITQVQRQAAMITTGAMRTSATDALEAHLQLLPMDSLVDKVCFRATAQMCAVPSSHPLFPRMSNGRSQMHELLQTSGYGED